MLTKITYSYHSHITYNINVVSSMQMKFNLFVLCTLFCIDYYLIFNIPPQLRVEFTTIAHTFRFCLSKETQYHSLARYQSDEIKIFNISFRRIKIELTIYHAYNRTFAPLHHNCSD